MPFKRQRFSTSAGEHLASVSPADDSVAVESEDGDDFEDQYMANESVGNAVVTDDAVEGAGYIRMSHGWIQRAQKEKVQHLSLENVHTHLTACLGPLSFCRHYPLQYNCGCRPRLLLSGTGHCQSPGGDVQGCFPPGV